MSQDSLLPRRSKGKRSVFFDDPGIDNLYSVVLELSAELSAARDRIDTLERLLDAKGMVSRQEVEDYRPDADVAVERDQRRSGYLRRLFGVFEYPSGTTRADDD